MTKIKVLLTDDHEVVRAGYRFLLENTGDIQVVGEAGSGEEAYAQYPVCQPDVVVMDLTMPGMGGLEAIRKLLARDKNARILVFSLHEDEVFLHRTMDAGALGYITKRSASEIMEEAVRQVAQGKLFVSQDMLAWLVKRRNGKDRPFSELSEREFEVFSLLAEGKSVIEISKILTLSAKTVGNHATNIKNKLEVANVAELIRLAIRKGFIEA
ncbi:MAG: response regulator transcription factor [Gammaproteobacteria bacterium]|nr:response regulator transcription factor [Gammaproteobacteria bacterium]